ncbi:hypothetical protein SEUCBS139899_008917 [Sporothrix eucalyptigena]|uniref:beta-fructofuranosidase n=1 Tax=Sporothrix eucalyptigena TaxID=1812306 RepID=A0ABP0CL73_9PEZI
MANSVPTPPPDDKAGATVTGFSRISPAQAAADAIPLLVNDDTYHLFHLTTPPFTRHHPARLRSSWWRMRSQDLVHWTRDAQPCIMPGGGGNADLSANAPDADGAWTGAAVIGPGGGMNIFYTGYNLSQDGRQVILRTQAHDKTASSFGYPGSEIQINGAGRDLLEDVDFRDPFVFYNSDESRYWMVVASRLAQGPYWSRGCIALLTSTDLNTWQFAPEPLYTPGDLFCPECPELFFLPTTQKWYLVYSRFHAPNAGTVYRIADSPYGPFRVPRDGSQGRLDGRRWYAAKSCAKAGDPSTRIFFGWIGDYVEDEGKWLWGGDLGIPREVSAVTGTDYLSVSPAAAAVALAKASSTAVPSANVPRQIALSSSTAGTTTVMPLNLSGTTAKSNMDVLLSMTFDVADCSAHTFGVIFQPDDQQRGYRLQFRPSISVPGMPTLYTVTIFIDFPPLDDFWADQYNLHLPRPVDGPEIVRHDGVVLSSSGVQIFLRRQLVEIFCGGRSISFRLPRPSTSSTAADKAPHSVLDSCRRVSWFVEDGKVSLENVSIRYGGQLNKIVT